MVTIKDVAKLANVPEKTVMRALAGQIMGKRRDAQERAERVFAAAEKLGYRPSAIAASLRKGRTKNIGLLVGSITNRYYAALTEIVMEECNKLGYHLSVELPSGEPSQIIASIDYLLRHRVDGIFFALALTPNSSEYFQKLVRNGFPVIMLHANEIGITSVARDYSAVLPEAVQNLCRNGVKKITLAQWNRYSSLDQRTGDLFMQECSNAHLCGKVLKMNQLTDVTRLFDERPDAIICDAPYCLKYFYSKKPSDYTPLVAGVYDEWNVIDRPKDLSGIIMMPSNLQICTAVKKLIDMIENGSSPENTVFHGKYIPREHFSDVPEEDLAIRHLIAY